MKTTNYNASRCHNCDFKTNVINYVNTVTQSNSSLSTVLRDQIEVHTTVIEISDFSECSTYQLTTPVTHKSDLWRKKVSVATSIM